MPRRTSERRQKRYCERACDLDARRNQIRTSVLEIIGWIAWVIEIHRGVPRIIRQLRPSLLIMTAGFRHPLPNFIARPLFVRQRATQNLFLPKRDTECDPIPPRAPAIAIMVKRWAADSIGNRKLG